MIDIQRSIGADIMMAFDECPPGDAPYDYAARLDLTWIWLERCLTAIGKRMKIRALSVAVPDRTGMHLS